MFNSNSHGLTPRTLGFPRFFQRIPEVKTVNTINKILFGFSTVLAFISKLQKKILGKTTDALA